MSAFPQMSQAELMEQYANFCMFQKQQQQSNATPNMFEQFMKQTQNTPNFSQQVPQTQQYNQNFMQAEMKPPEQPHQSDLPLFERFMKEQFKQSNQNTSFIPFDIDNFNGDGLQKAFDLSYQNETKKLASM